MSMHKKPNCPAPCVKKCSLLHFSVMLLFATVYNKLDCLWKAASTKCVFEPVDREHDNESSLKQLLWFLKAMVLISTSPYSEMPPHSECSA